MKRLLLVYNPRSSHFWQVKKDVLSKIGGLKGWTIGKFEVSDTDVDDNAARLARVIFDHDLIISAGGDGTANIAVNAIMLSSARDVRIGVLAYGNFNDMARSLGELAFDEVLKMGDKAQEIWPLECKINQRHWRYGMCYFTMGMFAEACAVFDHPKVRKKLQKGRKHLISSLMILARWWLRQRKKKFLPSFALGNSSEEYVERIGVSDYMAVNSRTVARIMKGGKWFLDRNDFLSETGQMTRMRKLVPMMLKSMFKQIPGIESDYDRLIFEKPAKIMMQAEGEYKMIENVNVVEIKKAEKPILAVMR